MSNKDDDLVGQEPLNPLTEAIFEAADDLEKGRMPGPPSDPLAAFPDPMASASDSFASTEAFGTEPLAAAVPSTADGAAVVPEAVPGEEAAQGEAAEEEEKKPSIWSRLAETSPYTVLLGAAMVAVLVGIIFMLVEMAGYDWELAIGAGAGGFVKLTGVGGGLGFVVLLITGVAVFWKR